jgi:hypothetical protein
VTPPDDRESKPSSSTPPGGNPSSLPPRLRDKLGTSSAPESDDADFDFLKKRSPPLGIILTFVIIIGAVLGIATLVIQSKQKAKAEAAAEAARAAAAHAAAVADSMAQARQADSLKAVAHADSIAFAKLPKWKQKQILAEKAKKAGGGAAAAAPSAPAKPAGGQAATGASTAAGGAASGGAAPGGGAPATAAEPATPKEVGPFGIDAGQFLDETRANQVADELKTKTSLAARVVNMNDTYHVLLGSYSSRGAAEAKANSLLSKGMVEQAGVVALPKSP